MKKTKITDNTLTPERIITAISAAQAPLELEHLGRALDISLDRLEELKQQLDVLHREGQVLINRKGLVLLPSRIDLLAGRVQGHRDGFGFLIRDDGEPDVFLPAKEMTKVLHGDRVLVKIVGTDRRGKPEGSIVEVIERRTNKLVGRFLAERGVTIVVPEDQRIKHDVLVPGTEAGGAQPGQVVMVEILQQPSRYSQPLGRVVEVLGEIDDPGMEIEIAVRKFDVPYQFSEQAKQVAAALPEEVTNADREGRIDLRDIPLVTIDGEDARDFDDAVYCEPIKIGKGKAAIEGFRLLVAIADVSHYVKEGDALDSDARLRSTSVYFPRRVIPMLPEKISNGLCSLNPAVDRLCMVCDMVITDEGIIHAYQFYPAIMHSQARLTYNEVWSILSQPTAPARIKYKAVVPQLENLYELFRILDKARQLRGAIDFETVETYIECNAAGKIERIVPRTRNDAHKLIEECMLAANVCAADFVSRQTTKNGQLALFRVHEGPTPDKLLNLREFLKSLGLLLGGGSEPQAKDYAALMKKIIDRPDYHLLQSMLLRSMQRAHYSPDNAGHFGLAYEAYSHFTSPIRRYPDLTLHRVIKAIINNETYVPLADTSERHIDLPKNKKEALALAHQRWEKLGLVCSANERRADDASSDVQAWLKCYYMRDRIGEDFSGTISGVTPFGIFVTLDSLYVDGLVHVSELGVEYFQFNEQLHELRGERSGIRFRLTDRIHVQVARVDLEARRIEFRMTRGTALRLDSAAVADSPSLQKKPAKPRTAKVDEAIAARKTATVKDSSARKRKKGVQKRASRNTSKNKRNR